MKDCTLGLFLEVGLSQFEDLVVQSEVDAKGRWWWFVMGGLGFGVDKRFEDKWVKREVDDSVRSG